MDNLELILFNYSKIAMPRVGGYRLCIRKCPKRQVRKNREISSSDWHRRERMSKWQGNGLDGIYYLKKICVNVIHLDIFS